MIKVLTYFCIIFYKSLIFLFLCNIHNVLLNFKIKLYVNVKWTNLQIQYIKRTKICVLNGLNELILSFI